MARILPFLLALAPALFAQEFAVTLPAPAPGVLNQYPSAATAGDLTLVAWTDLRGFGNDIYAARLDAAGRVLDPNGIFIAHAAGRPSVLALPSGDFLVAVNALQPCGQIDVLKVGRDGSVSPRKTVTDISPRCAETVHMATNGASILMLVNDTRYFLLDLDGNVLTTSAMLTDHNFPTAVAGNGDGYLIAIGTSAGVTTTAVSRDGVAAPAQTAFTMPDTVVSVAVASNGATYIVGGTALAQITIQIAGNPPTTTNLTSRPITLGLTWDGSSYEAAWTEQSPALFPGSQPSLFTARVDAVGHLQNVAPIGLSDPFFTLTPAFTVRVDMSRLMARPLGGGSDVAVVNTPTPQTSPLMVATTNGGVVLWHELSPQTTRAEVLDALGRPTGNVAQVDPASLLAFDGVKVVLAWKQNTAFVARRYTPSLDPVDPAPIVIAFNVNNLPAAIAAGGGTTLFLWSSGAALLPRSGAPIPVALPLLSVPAAAWNGSEYLVADAYPAGTPPPESALRPEIDVYRVTPAGAVLDTHTIARLTYPVRAMSVASNGSNFLVMWVPYFPEAPNALGKFVDANGATDAADPLTLAPADLTELPVLAAYGSTYAVVWRTQWRFVGEAAQSLPPLPVPGYAAGLSAATIGSRLVVAYARIDDSAGGVPRVFVRTLAAPRTHAAR